MAAPGGGSMNRYYLPERYARTVAATVPENDRAVIREVFAALDEPISSQSEYADPVTRAIAIGTGASTPGRLPGKT